MIFLNPYTVVQYNNFHQEMGKFLFGLACRSFPLHFSPTFLFVTALDTFFDFYTCFSEVNSAKTEVSLLKINLAWRQWSIGKSKWDLHPMASSQPNYTIAAALTEMQQIQCISLLYWPFASPGCLQVTSSGHSHVSFQSCITGISLQEVL